MDHIPTDQVQNVDNPASQVIEDCLTNPVVLRRILENFPNTELLQLSFVNKFWNHEARSLMRKRGSLIAFVGRDRSSNDQYKKLKAFGRDLLQMNVVPFCGITIELWGYNRDRGPRPATVLRPTYQAILDKLTLKHLSLNVYGYLSDHRNSQELLLTKTILDQFSPGLETLSLYIESQKEVLFKLFFGNCNFPRLKILKLPEDCSPSDESYTNLLKVLVSRAPNLQELHKEGKINLQVKLLEGSSAVLVSHSAAAPFDEISDGVVSSLRLKYMRLLFDFPEHHFERFNRITPILLQVCCKTTLREVQVDAVLAVALMSYGVCLENVNKLGLMIDYGRLELTEPRILGILKEFDFTKIFPSLIEIAIGRPYGFQDLSLGHMTTIIENATAVLGEPLPDRAFNINHLEFRVTLSDVNAQFYAEMFPNITELEALNCEEDIPIGSFWKYWKDLEKVRVKGKITGNLDSIFCGIFPEEVAELEQKDDEYLKRVNIVPVMPAMTCLRSLKSFTLDFDPSQDPTFLFTKVTGLIAFARNPTVAIQMSADSDGVSEALDRMEPYASVADYISQYDRDFAAYYDLDALDEYGVCGSCEDW